MNVNDTIGLFSIFFDLCVDLVLQFLCVEKFRCDGIAIEDSPFESIDRLEHVSALPCPQEENKSYSQCRQLTGEFDKYRWSRREGSIDEDSFNPSVL